MTCPASISISLSYSITITLVCSIQQAPSIISMNKVHHLGLLIILFQSRPHLCFFYCYPYDLGFSFYYLKAGFQISISFNNYTKITKLIIQNLTLCSVSSKNTQQCIYCISFIYYSITMKRTIIWESRTTGFSGLASNQMNYLVKFLTLLRDFQLSSL